MSEKYGKYDVLTLKGAAAQQTTHPGNLAYYELCEQRYDEFSKTESKKARRSICQEVVSKIVNEYGGVFRKYNGAKMDNTAAVNKTMDRFRQIRKPKIVPPKSVGENDVVFKVGAANHLFPGNAKWRLLLDEHARSYWPELFAAPNDESDTKDETSEYIWKRVRGQRPYYQVEISHKLIDIIEGRGGKFRNAALNVMEEREGILAKIHERFKDIKKYIKNGTYQSALGSTDSHGQDVVDKANVENFYVIKRTGCTSTKATILHGEHETVMVSSGGTKKNKKGKKTEGEIEGEVIGDEEGSLGSVESHDQGRNAQRKEQAEARRERAKRREEAIKAGNQVSLPKPKRKRRKKSNVIMPPELPDGEISDYEKLRFQKMQRNYERMVSLGLCGATAEV